MIVINNATKLYRMGGEEIRALDGLSLKIEDGDFIALVGPSGSGKSTLLNMIGALDSLDEGKILVDGTDISRIRDRAQAKYRRQQIGFVFQTFNLQGRLTALENVELPLLFEGLSVKERKNKGMEALSRVRLTDRVSHKPSQLSGGQQQRVAIARALVNNPKVLLADEPTGNLDSKSGEKIMKLLKTLNSRDGVTVVMVTHNTEHAEYADRVLHMRDGMIADQFKGTKS